jgi:methylmalonyl-CoA mutase C-terminal domain/subunit
MLGVDIHNKGIRTLARLLRDRGVEVIYIGEHNSPQAMARTALTEDVDVVGVSFSISSYMGHVEHLVRELRAVGADDVAVMVGGLIHDEDVPALLELGVGAVFGPGSSTDAVMEFLYSAKDDSAPASISGCPSPTA